MYASGDIVLIPFPFSDLSSQKLRPALIVSSATYNKGGNYVVIGIYGNPGESLYTYPLLPAHLQTGEMKKQSYIRFQNTFSVHHGLIVKRVGSLTPSTLTELQRLWKDFF